MNVNSFLRLDELAAEIKSCVGKGDYTTIKGNTITLIYNMLSNDSELSVMYF